VFTPELLGFQIAQNNASKTVEQWPSIKTLTMNTISLVPVILKAKIPIPPLLLARNGNASLQQVVRFTLQYNDLVNQLAQQTADNIDRFFDPSPIRRPCLVT